MQILRSILCPLRRPGVATSPALMQCFSFPSRPLLSFVASAPRRLWAPALARRVFPFIVAPDPPVRRISGCPDVSWNMVSTSVENVKESGKPDIQSLISSTKEHSAVTQGMKNVEKKGTANEFRYADGRPVHVGDERRTSMDVIYGDEDACRTKITDVRVVKHDACEKHLDISVCQEDRRSAAMDHTREIVISDDDEDFFDVTMDRKGKWLVSDDEEEASSDAEMPRYPIIDGVLPMYVFPKSRHRDGSIYRATHIWKRNYHIANRNETEMEAMMLSDPKDCVIRDGTCITHLTCPMLQIFSLKLAELHVDRGSVELYGYIAVRDNLDSFLNYIVNISRDDPIIVEQGSLINMAGPKRGIELCGTTLFEYDMSIKTGEQEKDDLPLIDGVSHILGLNAGHCYVFTKRIYGDHGAIDLTASCLQDAVEATVEVLISEVRSNFNLCLRCFTSVLKEEIRLFDSAISESRGLKRSVVAVVIGSTIDLKFKVGAESFGSAEHCYSFKADVHGRSTGEIKTDFGLITVNVAWSTLLFGPKAYFYPKL